MIDNSWVLDVESRIFTKVKGRTYKELNKKYPNIYFTTAEELAEYTDKKYTVFINELQPIEQGQTLDGNTINAIMSTFQIRVTTTTSKEDCRDIYKAILNAMKDLQYDVVMIPTIKQTDGLYEGVGRFRRMLGALDII